MIITKMNSSRRCLLCSLTLALSLLCSFASAQSDAEAAGSQVINLFKIFKARDWKALYDVTAFTPEIAKGLRGRDDFAAGFAKGLHEGDPDDSFSKLIDSMSDVFTGLAIVEKDTAVVATSCNLTFDKKKVAFLGIAKLAKVDGKWKWDLTFSNDLQKATAQRFTELFGSPARG